MGLPSAAATIGSVTSRGQVAQEMLAVAGEASAAAARVAIVKKRESISLRVERDGCAREWNGYVCCLGRPLRYSSCCFYSARPVPEELGTPTAIQACEITAVRPCCRSAVPTPWASFPLHL